MDYDPAKVHRLEPLPPVRQPEPVAPRPEDDLRQKNQHEAFAASCMQALEAYERDSTRKPTEEERDWLRRNQKERLSAADGKAQQAKEDAAHAAAERAEQRRKTNTPNAQQLGEQQPSSMTSPGEAAVARIPKESSLTLATTGTCSGGG
jgi:hypothetical protein